MATPIGNLEDITLRALRILSEADFILAEDTRKTGVLLKHFKISKKMISFYEHKEAKRKTRIMEELKNGKKIALVSNAGTPAISDPGYKLIRECQKENIPTTSLPGASSIINALVLTSIPHDKFSFLGYIPRKRNERKRLFEETKEKKLTAVFFESPYRLLRSLEGLKEVFGDKRIAIAREMTKKFEEVLELNIEEAINHFEKNKPRGEFVIII